ncbi:AIPR family protein [Kitasatospora sp. NBC_00315]|uniref:AIPR family protein n=1 Tax=Kitasatospora sp. NBC_00315 TaxID=2975963 RepID=UPI00324BEF2B
MSILHIRQIAASIQRTIGPHLDLSDLAGRGDTDSAVLTRGLSALAVQMLTGFSPADAAACVVDGFNDNGIDAVAVDADHHRIILVQSKWHADGRKTLNAGEALKLVQGTRDLFRSNPDPFNERVRRLMPAIESSLNEPETRIVIAIATTGGDQLPAEVQRPLVDLLTEINDGGDDLVSLRVLGSADLHGFLTHGTASQKVDLTLNLSGWGSVQTPYQAYYGVASAIDIAGWYDQYGDRLFDGNIREALGSTAVNDALVTTLDQEPEHFWYFNNGITVLAESVNRAARGSQNRAHGQFHLSGATVVNGAQTAASIHALLQRDEALLEDAAIWIRVIALDGCPDGFAASVTRATNTQNGVGARDFVALDPGQDRIRAQLRLQFDKAYGVKRSAQPITGAAGCDVEEAAIALACANPDPAFAVDAKRQVSLLWASTNDPTYLALFPAHLDVARLWNSVLILRQVETELGRLKNSLASKASGVLVHGNRLIAHLVMSQLEAAKVIQNPEAEAEGLLDQVPDLTRLLAEHLRNAVNAAYPANTFLQPLFKNHSKCRHLVETALSEYSGTRVSLPEPRRHQPAAPQNGSGSADSTETARTVGISRMKDAIKVIQEASALPEGALLLFKAGTERERNQMLPWIQQDPRRGRVRWTNEPPYQQPLIWEYDDKRYSPSNLVTTAMIAAGMSPPSGVRGPRRWATADDETLVQIAKRLLREGIVEDR